MKVTGKGWLKPNKGLFLMGKVTFNVDAQKS